ncbi:MAG: glycosyltransferase family 2 protein [Ferrimicrobium sp.]
MQHEYEHDLTIIMPAYNEERYIYEAISNVYRAKLDMRIQVLVVDDGSSDATYDEASRALIGDGLIERLPQNQGKGAALAHAFAMASSQYCVIMDADLEYDASDIQTMWDASQTYGYDFVLGERTFAAHSAHSLMYVLGNKATTTFVNVLFNRYLGDIHSGLKLLRTDLARSLELRSRGFGADTEMVAKLLHRGYVPYEVPVTYRARSHDEGKKIRPRDGLISMGIAMAVRLGIW